MQRSSARRVAASVHVKTVECGRPVPSKRNLPDKASTAQSLDGNRLTGSLLIPRSRTIGDRSFNMQAGDETKLRFTSSATSDRSQPSVGRTQRQTIANLSLVLT